MRYPIVQISTVGRHRVHLPLECYRVDIWPNEHKNHVSYGHVLMSQWRRFEGAKGMLWLEGDVAIEPLHLSEIDAVLDCYPDVIVAVPYRIYPASTQRQRPIFSNQGNVNMGLRGPFEDISEPSPRPYTFGLGCTYLPRRLLDLVTLQGGNYDYPCLDTRLSEIAESYEIPCHGTSTLALHLHY